MLQVWVLHAGDACTTGGAVVVARASRACVRARRLRLLLAGPASGAACMLCFDGLHARRSHEA
eukprot:7378523-Prymnesium_polylepis.1